MNFSQRGIAYARLGTRGIQFLCCLFGLAFTAGGYRYGDMLGFSGSASTSQGSFVILMTYTGMLYSLWHLAAVEIFRVANRLLPMVEQGIDGLLAFMLLIGGSAHAASGAVRHCTRSNLSSLSEHYSGLDSNHGKSLLRCSSLRTGVAFTFLAMFAFIASIAITFIAAKHDSQSRQQNQEVKPQNHDLAVEMTYQKIATPSAAPLSPMGHGV